MPSNSARLRARLALMQPALDRITGAFWTDPRLPELYPRLLLELHPLVRAGSPILERAAEVARARVDDPLGPPLAEYYAEHAEEERGHDEWVLDDLEHFGYDREQVRSRVPSAPVAALFGAQYFWVLHAHPLALMGYIACVEGRHALEPELDRIIERTGLPEAAFSNYRNHARLDPQHQDDIYALLDRLPLDDRHHEILGLSAMYTCNALGSLFASLSRA